MTELPGWKVFGKGRHRNAQRSSPSFVPHLPDKFGTVAIREQLEQVRDRLPAETHHLDCQDLLPTAGLKHCPVEMSADSKPEHCDPREAEEAEPHDCVHSLPMGSLHTGTSETGGDVNGFKIVLADGARGAVAVQGMAESRSTTVSQMTCVRSVLHYSNRSKRNQLPASPRLRPTQ